MVARRHGNADLPTGTAARRAAHPRIADCVEARGRLGTPTSGQSSRWGPAPLGAAQRTAPRPSCVERGWVRERWAVLPVGPFRPAPQPGGPRTRVPPIVRKRGDGLERRPLASPPGGGRHRWAKPSERRLARLLRHVPRQIPLLRHVRPQPIPLERHVPRADPATATCSAPADPATATCSPGKSVYCVGGL